MRIVATITMMFMCTLPLVAQLQITRADVDAMMGATEFTSYQATNAEGMTFDLSGPVYDLTVFTTTSETFSTDYVDPSLTPWPHEFPTATVAQVFEASEGNGFMYLRIDDAGLYMLGFASEVSGTDYLLKYNPERPQMKFPFKKGSGWTYTSDVMSPFEGMTRQEDSEVTVIAEGTLRTPAGDYPCIVVKQLERATTKLEFGGQVISEDYMTDVTYEFITKSGVSATIVIDTLDQDSSTPTLVYASWAVRDVQTSAAPVPAVSDLHITSAWPNPVRTGVLTVDWTGNGRGSAQLSVVDALGRERALLYEGTAAAGRMQHRSDLRGLPTGQYFLRLFQGGTVAMRPFSVVH